MNPIDHLLEEQACAPSVEQPFITKLQLCSYYSSPQGNGYKLAQYLHSKRDYPTTQLTLPKVISAPKDAFVGSKIISTRHFVTKKDLFGTKERNAMQPKQTQQATCTHCRACQDGEVFIERKNEVKGGGSYKQSFIVSRVPGGFSG